MYLYPREVGVISPLLSLSITHQMHGSEPKALPLNNPALRSKDDLNQYTATVTLECNVGADVGFVFW